jgi:hypothetical protein
MGGRICQVPDTTPITSIDFTLIMIVYSKWLLAELSVHIARKTRRIAGFVIFYLAASASENRIARR